MSVGTSRGARRRSLIMRPTAPSSSRTDARSLRFAGVGTQAGGVTGTRARATTTSSADSVARASRSASADRSVPNSACPTTSSAPCIMASSTSTTDPGGRASQLANIRWTATSTWPTMCSRVSWWKAGWTSGRCRRHASVSATSRPSPVTRDRERYWIVDLP